jgi:protein-S-isoprenylcysteine O-methyltransferase Ste14
VVLQSVALAGAGLAGVLGPRWPTGWEVPLRIAGGVLAAGGGAIAWAGIRHLGEALSPFPKPLEGTSLRDRGVYALVRHPIYGGLLLVTLGWSAMTSPAALAFVALLALVFEGKRRREEAWLVEHVAGYDAYRRTVRRRFVPFVW